MKRAALVVVAVVALGVSAGCEGETEPPTDLTPTSAKLHSAVNCVSDNSGEWWYQIAEDHQDPANYQFVQVGPQHDFNCPADEDPNTAGYQCSAGVCNGPFDITHTVNTLEVCQEYVYRIRARVDNGSGGAYLWVDSNGIVNDNVYDEIPAQRPGSGC